MLLGDLLVYVPILSHWPWDFEPDLVLMTGQESIARVHIEHCP